MNLVKILTPKDTEEVKPGLFIQKTLRGYRHITPAAWNGKINWKVAIFGTNVIKNLLFFLLLMFLCWSYYHDTHTLIEWQNNIVSNPQIFCSNMSLLSNINIDNLNFSINANANSLQNLR